MKKAIIYLLILMFFIGLVYFSLEQIISLKISSDLKEKFGDSYAILKMQIGGKPVEKVSLWRMLNYVYKYNFTKEYEPQGSACLTGKSYYLTPLISDNNAIYPCNWSFRMFKLDISDSSMVLWDIIDNIPDEIAPLYRFNKKNRVKRGYLWFSEFFNDDRIRYYYRPTKNVFTESNKANGFSGEWFKSDDDKGYVFILELQQAGNKLAGKYTAIAMHGNRIDADPEAGRNIYGTINGNKADVVFSSFYGQGMGPRGSETGKATIVHHGDFLEWKVVEPSENGFYFCPNSIELRLQDKQNRVFVTDGNIFYSNSKSNIKLTNTGFDRQPILSPDGKKVVFIRKSDKEAYLPAYGDKEWTHEELLADQVWVVDVDGKNEKLLAEDFNPDYPNVAKKFDGRKAIGHIEDKTLQFSPDGKKVYFLTWAWVTSSALHAANVDGSGQYFVSDANTLKVIDKGGYKGYLIVNKHKYFITGGTYDWYWLVSPEGEEIGPLGEDLEYVDMEFLYSDFINSSNKEEE